MCADSPAKVNVIINVLVEFYPAVRKLYGKLDAMLYGNLDQKLASRRRY